MPFDNMVVESNADEKFKVSVAVANREELAGIQQVASAEV
jgi:hypothetical protein